MAAELHPERFAVERRGMVETQLRARGIADRDQRTPFKLFNSCIREWLGASRVIPAFSFPPGALSGRTVREVDVSDPGAGRADSMR